MYKRNNCQLKLALLLIISCLCLIINACSSPTVYVPVQTTQDIVMTTSQVPAPPQSPVNLTSEAESCSSIFLQWVDNSYDEDGFTIYRDNILIKKTGPNASSYQDINLNPCTTYRYSVMAYNRFGESEAISYSIKTPNPPIVISLEKIGLFDNREDFLRGEDGEIYLYVAVYDGKNPAQKIRFPQFETQQYKLAKNEIININSLLFSSDEVGNQLTLFVIGFEDDGGGLEPLVYEALGAAINSQLALSTGGISEAFNLNLYGLVGELFGQEDDYLGTFEHTWDVKSNWGIGQYPDVVCKDERGMECLRLWFSITTQ